MKFFYMLAQKHTIKPIHGNNFHSCVWIFFLNSPHPTRKNTFFAPLLPLSFTLYKQWQFKNCAVPLCQQWSLNKKSNLKWKCAGKYDSFCHACSKSFNKANSETQFSLLCVRLLKFSSPPSRKKIFFPPLKLFSPRSTFQNWNSSREHS